MDEDFWQEAGRIKADYKRVSLADCFCVALSNRVSGEVVTSDHHEINRLLRPGCAGKILQVIGREAHCQNFVNRGIIPAFESVGL